MFYSIFRQEVAGAYSPVEIPNEVAFGYGAWFLVAVFLCRLVSNPALIPYFLATVLTGGLFLLLTLWLMLLPKGRPRPRFLGYVTTPLQQ
jgi:hypothetical protein